MADKLDKMREKLEKIMYDIAVYMADERGLSYREIRDNFEISIDDTIDLLEFQYPEISSNGDDDQRAEP
tara:strand:+ start:370 stop:576 length:207 start_codon:yes stop_codon:yes gene_type:complete